jgi:hypothetical protein
MGTTKDGGVSVNAKQVRELNVLIETILKQAEVAMKSDDLRMNYMALGSKVAANLIKELLQTGTLETKEP